MKKIQQIQMDTIMEAINEIKFPRTVLMDEPDGSSADDEAAKGADFRETSEDNND